MDTTAFMKESCSSHWKMDISFEGKEQQASFLSPLDSKTDGTGPKEHVNPKVSTLYRWWPCQKGQIGAIIMSALLFPMAILAWAEWCIERERPVNDNGCKLFFLSPQNSFKSMAMLTSAFFFQPFFLNLIFNNRKIWLLRLYSQFL